MPKLLRDRYVGDLLLGLDIGTSAVKAGLVGQQGALVGLGRADYQSVSPHPGWAECDPESWWHGALDSLARACAGAAVSPDQVAAVGISALFPVVVAMDANCRALYPAILYSDRRSAVQVERIGQAIPRDEYEACIGNVLMPGTCAVTSLAWLRDERPEVYGSAHSLGFANTFLAGRLTGQLAVDPSTVSLSGLADIRDPWQWSDRLCETLSIDGSRLPAIAGASQTVGEITRQAASDTGLRAGTPVVCGCGDVIASTLAVGAVEEEDVVLTTGSTNSVTAPLKSPTRDRRWLNCAYIPRNMWVAIGTMTSAGAAVEWFAREILGRDGPDGLKAMTELAAMSPPGSNGIVFLPYLQGERTPIWDPDARGMFFGVTSASRRSDFARAVFEGVAMGVRHVFEGLEEHYGRFAPEVRVVGGATQNTLWTQIKADVLQHRLTIVECQETSALGAALLAGISAGWYGSFDEIVGIARARCHGRTVSPNPEVAAQYAHAYAVYRGLYPATRDLM